jgi:hypothetical protein
VKGTPARTNATRWGCVDHAPPGLGGFDQFERHRDASGPRAGALGDALAEAHNRLGRSIRHLIDQLQALAEREVGFRSLQETIDTRSPGVRLVFHVFAALAEFERDLIRKRTNAGLKVARARGRTGGRPPSLSADQARAARRMYEQKDMPVAQIGKVLGVDRTTIYRALNRAPFTTSPPQRPETPVQWGTPQHDTHHAQPSERGTAVSPHGVISDGKWRPLLGVHMAVPTRLGPGAWVAVPRGKSDSRACRAGGWLATVFAAPGFAALVDGDGGQAESDDGVDPPPAEHRGHG